ncbi:MAG: sigma 54-interacting transcriptional regulator, partial [Polaromonas sp.]|nr:sigma 54-interacting transcriptional regulator [Polaromonas sp.]
MRRGRFEQADGGTLFLDEIGDMPFDLQTRLLRVLSDGSFYRVGGHNAVKTNVRVIAATHQDLEQRVKDGVFREDLFHRLNVIRLRLPALRERREDVFMLTRHFLQQSAQQLGGEPKRISDAALQQLSQFDFPGNVRQLENICHWLTVMSPSQVVERKDLPPEVLAQPLRQADGHNAHPVPGAMSGGDAGTASAMAEQADNAAGAPRAEPSAAAQLWHADPLTRQASTQADGIANASLSGPATAAKGSASDWEIGLEAEALTLLASGQPDVWDVLTRKFEARLIHAALGSTRGRRIEAAQKLGIGRNTITRKIQELNLE